MAAKKKGSIASVPWRDGEVFLCPDRCGYAHEREDRVEQHVRAGRHFKAPKESPTRATGATDSGGEPQGDPEAVTEAVQGGEE